MIMSWPSIQYVGYPVIIINSRGAYSFFSSTGRVPEEHSSASFVFKEARGWKANREAEGLLDTKTWKNHHQAMCIPSSGFQAGCELCDEGFDLVGP